MLRRFWLDMSVNLFVKSSTDTHRTPVFMRD